MTVTRTLLLLGACAGLSAFAPANAADLGGSLKDDRMPVLAQSAARFYARVDGSYSTYDIPSLTESGQFDLVNAKIGNTWSVGGGVGYYINKNWRADLTIEERQKSNLSGTNGDTANFGTGASRNFGLSGELYMANVYYDFDCRCRFTPYVGGGLGFFDYSTTAGSAPNNLGSVNPALANGTITSGGGTSVAAALMAGAALNLTGRGAPAGTGEGYGGGDAARNLYLDVGYRFLYLSDVHSGQITNAINVGSLSASDLHAHEFRVGLRYDFH